MRPGTSNHLKEMKASRGGLKAAAICPSPPAAGKQGGQGSERGWPYSAFWGGVGGAFVPEAPEALQTCFLCFTLALLTPLPHCRIWWECHEQEARFCLPLPLGRQQPLS